MPEIKRQVACKVRINDILSGDYVKEEGWTPNYIKTGFGKISRANVLATIVGKNEDNTLTIDDGTDKINVRSFEPIDLESFNVGDVVLIIGKPREWNSQRYLIPEVIKKIEDKRWVKVRSLELKDVKNNIVKTTKVEKEEIVENPYDVVLKTIQDLDDGSGANYEEVCLRSKIKDAEEILTALMEQGEIFEIKPGRLKILE